ncbi:ABC-type transport auxiliary lipoprotein family protein [Pararhizobium gei]|uniref:ABC-type transport auxiliary lipoprotein family protein n=1 Tax=Pararhizobium gei TaxID=1395951 RepID=UPI0023DBC912|nr:ABC-type transport auxiliary lipoprotein family protein [Rhizobium gei]
MNFSGVSRVSAAGLLRASVLLLVAGGLAACGGKANNDTYSLSASPLVEGPASSGKQILVPEPTALKAIDSEQIVVRLSASEIQYLANSQWSDRLPKVVQAKLVQAFENTGKIGGVGKPGEGLAIDYQIVTEIRAFEVSTEGADSAIVEIFAKILNDKNGTVARQKAFRAVIPVRGSGNAALVASLDSAFATVAADIVSWTLKAI